VTLKAVETRPAPTDKPLTRDPRSPEPEPLAIGKPVEIRSVALAVLAVLAIVMMLQYAQSAIIPIVLGVLISYALEPIVARMTVWRVPRPIAAAIMLIGVTAAVGSLLYGLRTEAIAIVDQVCDHIEDFKGVGELLGE
jgi:predicted PurR-regulated permease PerM